MPAGTRPRGAAPEHAAPVAVPHRTSVYRGNDRRAHDVPGVAVLPVVAAAAFLGALAVGFTVLALGDPRPAGVDLRLLNALFTTACVVVALVAGYISGLRWRMVGDASSLRGAAALILLGLSLIVSDLLLRVDPEVGRWHLEAPIASAASVTIGLLFVAAVVRPPIDSGLTVPRMLVGALGVFAVSFVAVEIFPGLEAIRGWGVHSFQGPDSYALRGLLVALRVVLGVVALVRGFRKSSVLWTWFGLTLLGFALSYAFRTATPADDLWFTAGSVTMLVALLFALYGVSEELKRAFLRQRSWLFDSRVHAAASEARRRAERAEREERAHQARSAVLALQAATRELQASRPAIDDPADRSVREAIETEIELLRSLIAGRDAGDPKPFDVEALVRTVAVTYRVRGVPVDTSVPARTWAMGRPGDTVEVLQVLLDNAAEHAPGSAVRLWAREIAGRVEVRVDDRGHGVADFERRKVFERSHSTSGLSGHGLGLYVARRLMRDQGGDLWVEDSPGGGASFALSLPAAVHEEQPAWR